MKLPETCPACGADFTGEPIPEKDLAFFNALDAVPPYPVTHFSRCISIYDQGLDRTAMFRCPDCEKEWPR